jgi:hypothetical protein
VSTKVDFIDASVAAGGGQGLSQNLRLGTALASGFTAQPLVELGRQIHLLANHGLRHAMYVRADPATRTRAAWTWTTGQAIDYGRRMRHRRLFIASAALALGACASGPHPALELASRDLSCEQSQLKLEQIYPKKVRIEGCGKSAIYVDACSGYGTDETCGWGRQYANAFERDAAEREAKEREEAEQEKAEKEKAEKEKAEHAKADPAEGESGKQPNAAHNAGDDE